jgi:selenocysteine lyase/cysteine desulfurase
VSAKERGEFWRYVKESIVGGNVGVQTPFGFRRLTYCDYTATGRLVDFVEEYLKETLRLYGNTHTEDDATGCITTRSLYQAEQTIKRLVGAGKQYRIIEAGSGATAAIHRLQEILGIYIPPAAKELFTDTLTEYLGEERFAELEAHLLAHRPVVFVGPYEHHSNEISWRECFAEVVEIGLTGEGRFDLADLKAKVSDPRFEGRMKIGSFSAASNVTGLITPVYAVARIMHEHGALAFFDFSAAAPYMAISIHRDSKSYFDGIFFSPHKFLGGPGSSGILIIHERIYHKNLPPSMAGGGTVEFVNAYMQEYNPDIEIREKAGTPGIPQILKAALAMELKERMGCEEIEKREKRLLEAALAHLRSCPNIELIAPMDPEHNLPIISFNIRAEGSYLHPRFVVKLLNDLFGIQARAGCSCAGPYGHRLLHISDAASNRYSRLISKGNLGLKPGWARLSLHFLMSDEELEFTCGAIRFISEQGKIFLPLYSFDIHSGNWQHRDFTEQPVQFALEQGLAGNDGRGTRKQPAAGERTAEQGPAVDLQDLYREYFEKARTLAQELVLGFNGKLCKTTQRDLIPFVYY